MQPVTSWFLLARQIVTPPEPTPSELLKRVIQNNILPLRPEGERP